MENCIMRELLAAIIVVFLLILALRVEVGENKFNTGDYVSTEQYQGIIINVDYAGDYVEHQNHCYKIRTGNNEIVPIMENEIITEKENKDDI